MKKTLIIATRGGLLAVTQTSIVVSAIQKIYPSLEIRVKKIASEGDKDRRTTLWELKETGFFTSQLEDALVANEADIAVHSFKDLPTEIRKGLSIGACFNREFPEDCLVLARSKGIPSTGLAVSARAGSPCYELPKGAKVGTSSLRRTVQIKRLREDLQCVPIRGNVTTRLRRLDEGKYDAIVLARAGLERLNLAERISIIFDPTQFIPAPAQGALAVEIRADDIETGEIVSRLDDKNTHIETTAERLVFSALGCGCHAPAGVFAKMNGSQITISGCFSDPDGSNFRHTSISGPAADSETLAQSLADKLRR